MIETVINQCLGDLQPLAAVFSKMGGLIRVQREKKTKGNAEKRYPVVTKLPNDCEGGDYTHMMPDSSQSGILYFQLISKPVTVQVLDGVFREDAAVRVVGWFNSEKVSGSGAYLASNVAALIKQRQPNIGNHLTNISIRFTGFDKKDAEVFSAFSYDEAQSQYLMKPYDFFSFTIEVGYLFTPSCVPMSTPITNECA